MTTKWKCSTKQATGVVLALLFSALTVACGRKAEECRGLVSADAVAASGPVNEAFRDHLAGEDTTTKLGKFLADYRNYDLAITTSESQFEYEFIPHSGGMNFKGGGASYKLNRESGKIEEVHYTK